MWIITEDIIENGLDERVTSSDYDKTVSLPHYFQMFDEEVMPGILEAHAEKGKAFDDDVMVNCSFNDWADMLCKDGEIHPEQYNNYGYVGEYA